MDGLTDDEAGAFLLVKLLAQADQFVFHRLAGVFGAKDNDLLTGTGWPILAPDGIYQVVANAFEILAAFLLDFVGEFARVGFVLFW